MFKYIFSATLITISLCSAFSQQKTEGQREEQWVDSVYNGMTPDERVAQLFMVAAYSNGDEDHIEEINHFVRDEKVGGLIFMQGGPGRQLHLTNKWQELAETPLMIGMDLEWGLSMRLDSAHTFPRQMELGALRNDSLIREMGKEIGRQMKIMGIHVNFAPVADVNNNPANPVIGTRSFGENKELVGRKAVAYAQGLQDMNVLAVAKHFPGHGDTDKDSHHTLPVITYDKARIDNIESVPFRRLISEGVGGVMTAHLQVNALDDAYPASLSQKITTGYLREELGFAGLIFTDALNMKAIADRYQDGDAELLAFRAGADVLLFSQNIAAGKKKILEEITGNRRYERQLELSVKRILAAKYRFGLSQWKPLNSDNLSLRLNSRNATALSHEMHKKAITVLANKQDALPIRQLDNKSFAMVNFGEKGNFETYLNRFTTFTPVDGTQPTDQIIRRLDGFNYVVIGIFPSHTDAALREIRRIATEAGKNSTVIACYFGNPYDLGPLEDLNSLVLAYSNNSFSQIGMAESLFGAKRTDAALPVSISKKMERGTGQVIPPVRRLGYGIPEVQGISGKTLEKIDEIASESIEIGATPGCQVLVAKGGKVVYMKSFGYFTYDSIQKVEENTIYDLASVTKVLSTTQALMFLEEHGMIDLDKKISAYLPELKGTNKEDMVIRDILTHQAGLWPYLPFWTNTMDGNKFLPEYYSPKANSVYSMKISEDLYAKPVVKDSIWQWVIKSRVRKKSAQAPYDYKYSDMGYYMMQKMVEKILNQPLSDFMQQNYYDPIGMTSTGYNPLNRFSAARIAPTEQDNFFRKTLIAGMVHDQGAALYGGVAGHAGLFGTANDIAKDLQMLLYGGQYGGTRYFQRETVIKFTEQQYDSNRRGIGWDKPLHGDWFGPTAEAASKQTFGHTGFTGTAIWADPEFDLIYVFLANRIYPDAGNSKLLSANIRTRIQEVIYQAIWDYRSTEEVN